MVLPAHSPRHRHLAVCSPALWRCCHAWEAVAATSPARLPAPPAPPQVSSFTTNADLRLIPADASTHMIGRQKPKVGQRVCWPEGGAWCSPVTSHTQQKPLLACEPLRPLPLHPCCAQRVARQEAGATWAAARADNAARRDFTVNGLLYDPFR